VDLNEVLKAGGRGGSMGRNRMRSSLVIAEIALATVALIGAGLFIRSMQAAQNIDLGFDARHIGIVGVNPGAQRYDRPRGEQYYKDAVASARAVAGVEAAAVASIPPLGGGILKTVFPEGEQHNPNYRGTLVQFNSITPGYFGAIRLPLRAGRDFEEFDRGESKAVVIVNEVLARQLWPGQSAVGRRLFVVQQPSPLEVVGVAADSVINQIGESPQPMLYLPIVQEYVAAAALLVRTKGTPESVLGPVAESVKQLDRNARLPGTRTVQQAIEAGLWAPRMGAALLGIFGGLALVLAMIGVYGVMSYSVSQRTQEIGIRMALGAESGDVLHLVLRQGLTLALGGTAVGVAAALAVSRVVSGLLFGISARDPLTLVAVAGILGGVGLLACWVPARRATRVDPLVSLRYE
jgi:putative ABC transport system permease protein